MLMSRKRTHLEAPLLSVNGHTLEQVQSFKYLGLLLLTCHGLNTLKVLALGQGNSWEWYITASHSSPETLFRESMVWPHLEYASQVGNPYLQKDIKLLEGVQKFAVRICSKNYDSSYKDLLDTFELPEIFYSRLCLRLSLLFKIVHESYYFPPNIFVPMSSILRYAKPHMYHSHLHTPTPFFYSFVPCTISNWNALPSYVTSTTSPVSFKNAFISTLPKLYNFNISFLIILLVATF